MNISLCDPEVPETAAHVLVVDDDARIRTLLKKYLKKSGYLVTQAHDAAQARRFVSMFNFDILVVDVMMPDEDGLSFTSWIDGRMPVILLTARGETEARIQGLEAGADDYLAKPFEPKELRLRMDAILRRSPKASLVVAGRRILKLGAVRFDVERGELWRGDNPVRLTTAEANLMRLLARNANEPVSRYDMLVELGGTEAANSAAQERAIDVQITRLRRKIEETPRTPRFIKTVRGAGYLLSPESETLVEG
jgi:two-component system phosphate regulon response regulator OmpR